MQSAIQDWFSRVDRANRNNAQVLESMPDNPERGSYYWWAQVARENTGQALCDSGGHYGYAYEAPVPTQEVDPITVSFHDGKPDGATIHLVHWLENTLDAADETAQAIEELLYWTATWLYPTEPHYTYVRAFLGEFEIMRRYLKKYGQPSLYRFYAKRYGSGVIQERLDKMGKYDVQRWQREMSDDEYVSSALKEFPTQALKHLAENGLHESDWGGQYTYNCENDMSQDFQFDTLSDDYGDTYVILQTHNGCDARGGMSTPVVARAYDIDYFWCWTADVYCFECNESWEMVYYYAEDLEKWAHNVYPEKIEAWRKTLAEMGAMKAGQGVLSGFEGPHLEHVDAYVAQLIIDDYDQQIADQGEECYIPPYAMITIGNNELAVPDWDGISRYPAGATCMICPKCGQFSVGVSNSGAYGF
jgi:hypothetical protein